MKKVHILILTYFIVFTSLAQAQVVNPDNGHTYQYIPVATEINWTQARDSAYALGGHLITITSQEEQDFIETSLYNVSAEGRLWMGGTDEEVEGTWKWITGEQWSYTNWYGTNPGNGTEDYLEILT